MPGTHLASRFLSAITLCVNTAIMSGSLMLPPCVRPNSEAKNLLTLRLPRLRFVKLVMTKLRLDKNVERLSLVELLCAMVKCTSELPSPGMLFLVMVKTTLPMTL